MGIARSATSKIELIWAMNNEEGKCAPSTFSCRWAFSHAENRPAWKKQKTSFRGSEPAMIPAYNVSFHCYESKCSRPDLHFARAPVMVRDIKTTNRRHAAGLKSDSDRRNKKKKEQVIKGNYFWRGTNNHEKRTHIYICSFPAALSFPGKGIELFYVSKWLTRQGQGLDASSNFPVFPHVSSEDGWAQWPPCFSSRIQL